MTINKINISVLDENGRYIKLLKIIPYNLGGFAVILPKLLGSHIGRLEKAKVTYKNYATHIDTKRDKSEQYSAEDIVKFSYHADGFVQFSSTTNKKIVSGRNADGTPKGLGILSWPLDNPISTGASMTFSFWQLEGFDIAKPKDIDNRYVFETSKATPHPKAKFEENKKNGYAMAFYIIPNSIQGDVREINGRKYSTLAMMQELPNGDAFMRLCEEVLIVDISNQDFRIGISWFLVPYDHTDPGYIFLGPTDGKRGLVASYPAIDYGERLQMKDLTFSPTDNTQHETNKS